jgi:hypothetical protein
MKIKHGLSKHPLYRVWIKIKDRLYNPNHEAYNNYGGNGVTMCEEWKNDATKFIKWALDNGWKPGMQIDKDIIPNKLGLPIRIYSPEMCSVVTQKQNNRCTKYCVFIEYKGVKKTLIEWSEELNIDYATLHHRIFDFGYTIDEAFTLPPKVKRKHKLHEYNGEYKCLHEWCRIFNIKKTTMFSRVREKGMTIEQAINFKKI